VTNNVNNIVSSPEKDHKTKPGLRATNTVLKKEIGILILKITVEIK
jgi:hypothetical protein